MRAVALQRWVQLLLMLPVVLLCCVWGMLSLLLTAARHGPRTVLCRKKTRSQPPPVLQDPRLGNHGYAYLEEVRLHYVSTGPEDKPLMVLLHGFPEFWYSWRHQLREFQREYRVVAVDQRGFGDSDKPRSVGSYSVDRLAGDVTQLVKALGHSQCVLVGAGLGGRVAWTVALQCPALVSRLVILSCPPSPPCPLCPGHCWPSTSLLAFCRRLRKCWYFFFFQVPWLPELFCEALDFGFLDQLFLHPPHGVRSGRMTRKDVEAYKFTFSRGGDGFTAPLHYYRQLFRHLPESRNSSSSAVTEDAKVKVKAKVTVPTLVLRGQEDEIHDPRSAELSSQHAVRDGARAKVRVISGAGHWVHMDRPGEVNRAIREFLEEG